MAMRVQPGRYFGKITGQQVGENPSNGNLQLAFNVEILNDSRNKQGAGLRGTIIRTLTTNTAEWIWRDLEAMGYPYDDFTQLDKNLSEQERVEFHDLSGIEVPVQITEDMYEGKLREKWNFDFGGGIKVEAAQKSTLASANHAFNRRKVTAESGKPVRQPVAAGRHSDHHANANGVIHDDNGNEIPF